MSQSTPLSIFVVIFLPSHPKPSAGSFVIAASFDREFCFVVVVALLLYSAAAAAA